LAKKRKKGERHGRARRRAREAGTARASGTPGPAGPAAAATGSGSEGPAPTAARPSGRPRWWERYPGRLTQEREALQQAGYDPRPREVAGRLSFDVTVPFRERQVPMQIRYPDLYPYFRCEVFAPTDLGLAKHQNPLAGNLCLLEQSTRAWNPGSDTAAGLLQTQLELIARANELGRLALGIEVPQPEPVSRYYPTLKDSVIIMPPEAYVLGDRRAGSLRIRLSNAPNPTRGYVSDIDGTPTSLPDLSGSFKTARTVTAQWRFLDAPPAQASSHDFARELSAAGVISPYPTSELEITALCFPEETAYDEAPERGWLFLVRFRKGRGQQAAALVQAQRLDPASQVARIPGAETMVQKRVTLFGAGALGGPLAVLLLQDRIGTLRAIDFDELETGQIVRWPLGLGFVGQSKLGALAWHARASFPETTFDPILWRLGGSWNAEANDELELLDRALDTDLVVDATAELGVQQFLADECRARGITLVTVEAREGGYAGMVVRYGPDGACWMCFKLHQDQGKFVLPNDDRTGRVQPRGCGSPTFTGASFDLVPTAAYAARLIRQTLAPSETLGDTEYDVAMLFNRASSAGEVGATPRWMFERLEVHPDCEAH
jgi:ThiF family protein